MSDQKGLDQKLKKLAMAGLGAVTNAVEKSRDVIADLSSKESIQNFADRGEEALEQVKAFGADTVQKVKQAWDSSELAASLKEKPENLHRLAQLVHELPEDDRKAFHQMLEDLDNAQPVEDGSLHSDEAFEYGKTEPSERVQEAAEVAEKTSLVTPNDEDNINRIRTDDVNDHIPQSVPREY